MENYIGAKYKLSKSENFDNYMKALGVGIVTRKLGNTVSPIVFLSGPVNDVYTFHTVSPFKKHEMSFKPGVEFQETTIDGRTATSVVTFEQNKMVQIQKDGKVVNQIVREFFPEIMSATFSVEDVVSTRVYERV